MANITTAISVQIDKEDKEKATEILQKLGVSLSGLVNMTIKQLIMRGGIPFDVTIPKEEDNLKDYFSDEELDRLATELLYIKDHPEEYRSYNDVDELKKDLKS